MYDVSVIVGSLRKESFNRKLANALNSLKHPKLRFSMVQINDIPLYNQDLDNNLPTPVARFKQEITKAHALLFVTPEYNRSIPGVLKNLIDWGTRPFGSNVWADKPMVAIGTSPGAVGTAVAQSHLRSIMVSLGAIYLGQPEVYLVYKEGLIDDKYQFTIDSTRDFMQGFLDNFAKRLEYLERRMI
jgi:chromate reductase